MLQGHQTKQPILPNGVFEGRVVQEVQKKKKIEKSKTILLQFL